MRRRTFIGAVFSGLSITGLSARPPKPKEGSIPTRTFGQTEVELTIIGQGGARLGLMRTKEEARKHVRRAYDLGLNYFDCAHSYWEGHSEEVYGDVLSEVRKDVFITSKSTQRSAEGAQKELDLSLKRLKTDYIDLWQIHGVETKQDVERILGPGGALETFESARQKGHCRFIGFTGHHDPEVHLELLRLYNRWDSILMPLHAADPVYLSFEKQVLPEAVDRGIGIQGMKAFGNAFLLRSLNPRECLEYALSLPVDCVTVGCSTQGQLEEDVRIVQGFRKLSDERMYELRMMATQGVGSLKGPALEYWKKGS